MTRARTWIVPLLLAAGAACNGAGATSTGAGQAPPGAFNTIASRGQPTAFGGYTLFQPLRSKNVYLVDMEGNLAHRWETAYNTGQAVYMRANGNLLRAARDPEPSGPFRGGGEGGIVQEIAWDGAVVWEYKLSDDRRRHHHDLEELPNGNVLLIAWENRSYEEAIQAGANPTRIGDDGIWPDVVVEIEPVAPDGANIVWEWRAWDHLVQQMYRDKDNFGRVADHPELIDINAAPAHRARQDLATPDSVDQLRALGYLAGDDRPEIGADWLHTNSIDYNAELDQILLSSRHFSEIWIIDHSTTTKEATGHRGGRWGKGGDLLYRWGNPEAHGVGRAADRALFVQHDARWIEPGAPGAGNILLFNNGTGRLAVEKNYSSVLEIAPPRNADGGYVMEPGEPTGPAGPIWEYAASPPESLYSGLLSGAQRLPNGNTLIADGLSGRMIEVGAGNAVVWELTNPYREDDDPQSSARAAEVFGGAGGERGGGGPPPGGWPRPGSIYRATRIPPDHPGLRNLATGSGR